MIEHRAPHIRNEALAEPCHQVIAREGRDAEHSEHDEQRNERLIERRRVLRGETLVDDVL